MPFSLDLVSPPRTTAILLCEPAQLEDAAAAQLALADDEVGHLTAAADRFRPTRQPREEVPRVARVPARRAQRLAGVERWLGPLLDGDRWRGAAPCVSQSSTTGS